MHTKLIFVQYMYLGIYTVLLQRLTGLGFVPNKLIDKLKDRHCNTNTPQSYRYYISFLK